MAAEQQSKLVGDLKLERLGGSVKVRQVNGSGNEIYVPEDGAEEFLAVFQEMVNQ